MSTKPFLSHASMSSPMVFAYSKESALVPTAGWLFAFLRFFLQCVFDPLHQGGHPLISSSVAGRPCAVVEKKTDAGKVQMDAVDIVVVAYFLYEFIGQIADFLHGIVHRRPSAVKPFFHPLPISRSGCSLLILLFSKQAMLPGSFPASWVSFIRIPQNTSMPWR